MPPSPSNRPIVVALAGGVGSWLADSGDRLTIYTTARRERPAVEPHFVEIAAEESVAGVHPADVDRCAGVERSLPSASARTDRRKQPCEHDNIY